MATASRKQEIEAAKRSLSFAADYYSRKAKERVGQAEAALSSAWEGMHKASFDKARSALGRKSGEVEVELPAQGTTIEMDGMVLKIDERIAEQNVRKLMAGRHTYHERKILKDILKPGDRVMELGGGIGTVAITCARILGSENVLSYEANPGIEDLIRENYALNDVAPTLKICLVGEERSSRTFHVSERFSRSSLIKPEGKSRPVEVPVVPFKEEVEAFKPTVLVVDIQGSEREFLRHADLSSIDRLLIEFHPSMIGVVEIARLRKLLRKTHGFDEVRRESNCFVYRR